VPRITDFCSCVYVFGCRLSIVRLCDSDFGITPVDDITIGIICAAFCFHIAHIPFASSWYMFCLSAIIIIIITLSPLDLYMAYAVILEFTVFTVYVNLVNVFSVGLTFEISDSHPAY